MARPLRLHLPGGFYHVTLRGNHRLPIFCTEQDRSLLDELAAEVTRKHSVRVHAYCWMTNHLHLALQVADQPLGRVILELASRYARTVQSRLNTTGHLFERRYHAVLVNADRQLLALVRYIHLNPVEAGLVVDPAHYVWSSHLDYLGCVKRGWVHTSFVMRMLATTPAGAIANYAALMGSELPAHLEEYAALPCRGHKQAFEDNETAVTGFRKPSAIRPESKSLDELFRECVDRFGYSADLLASSRKTRGLAAARAWLSHESVSAGVTTICGIARLLNRSESAIRQLMQRYPRNLPRL